MMSKCKKFTYFSFELYLEMLQKVTISTEYDTCQNPFLKLISTQLYISLMVDLVNDMSLIMAT